MDRLNTDPAGKPVHLPRPERIKAAVLEICGRSDFDFDEAPRIDHVGEPIGFVLMIEGICVATSEHPVLLSEHAFRNGAGRVVHTYDLRLAE